MSLAAGWTADKTARDGEVSSLGGALSDYACGSSKRVPTTHAGFPLPCVLPVFGESRVPLLPLHSPGGATKGQRCKHQIKWMGWFAGSDTGQSYFFPRAHLFVAALGDLPVHPHREVLSSPLSLKLPCRYDFLGRFSVRWGSTPPVRARKCVSLLALICLVDFGVSIEYYNRLQ